MKATLKKIGALLVPISLGLLLLLMIGSRFLPESFSGFSAAFQTERDSLKATLDGPARAAAAPRPRRTEPGAAVSAGAKPPVPAGATVAAPE